MSQYRLCLSSHCLISSQKILIFILCPQSLLTIWTSNFFSHTSHALFHTTGLFFLLCWYRFWFWTSHFIGSRRFNLLVQVQVLICFLFLYNFFCFSNFELGFGFALWISLKFFSLRFWFLFLLFFYVFFFHFVVALDLSIYMVYVFCFFLFLLTFCYIFFFSMSSPKWLLDCEASLWHEASTINLVFVSRYKISSRMKRKILKNSWKTKAKLSTKRTKLVLKRFGF